MRARELHKNVDYFRACFHKGDTEMQVPASHVTGTQITNMFLASIVCLRLSDHVRGDSIWVQMSFYFELGFGAYLSLTLVHASRLKTVIMDSLGLPLGRSVLRVKR